MCFVFPINISIILRVSKNRQQKESIISNRGHFYLICLAECFVLVQKFNILNMFIYMQNDGSNEFCPKVSMLINHWEVDPKSSSFFYQVFHRVLSVKNISKRMLYWTPCPFLLYELQTSERKTNSCIIMEDEVG